MAKSESQREKTTIVEVPFNQQQYEFWKNFAPKKSSVRKMARSSAGSSRNS